MEAIKATISLVGLSLLVAGCSEITANGDVGPILLEIEYVNYAWTPTFHGFVVEQNGRIYGYDRHGASWTERTSYGPDELDDKFRPSRELVTTRPTSELDEVAEKIVALPEDQLSVVKHQCADAGTLTYRAYKYNAQISRYIPVLLRVEGDRAQQNTSAVAQNLIAYIRSLNLQQEFSGCDP